MHSLRKVGVEMARGGKRPNAGRKQKYASDFQLRLINAVGLLKAQNPLWTNQRILDELESQGKLDKMARATITRKLEKRFNKVDTEDGEADLLEILTTTDRTGILSVLPTLEKNN